MTRILISMAIAAALATAQQPAPAKAGAAKKAAGAAAAKKDADGIPPGAVLVEDGLWRHTDAQGRTWTYRRTPFGLIKTEGAPEPATPSGNLRVLGVTADEVEFESVTPFGKPRWKRPLKELSPSEQAALDRYRAAAPKEPAKDNK